MEPDQSNMKWRDESLVSWPWLMKQISWRRTLLFDSRYIGHHFHLKCLIKVFCIQVILEGEDLEKAKLLMTIKKKGNKDFVDLSEPFSNTSPLND